jgi:sulfatase modifying factor 1
MRNRSNRSSKPSSNSSWTNFGWVLVFGLAGACSSSHAGGDASATSDAGTAAPPSCAPGGPGLDNCGAGHESCCTSLLVPGGSYERTYSSADGGAASDAGPSGTDPATVSDFRLDKYDVTVGRFRRFVQFVTAADGGVGAGPSAGAGKHVHLAGGLGLTDVGPDAGAGHEKGWDPSDDVNVAPTEANLTSCVGGSTWTAAAGSQETLPINCVSWAEAYAFCIWDGGFLPSEAEWEYAAAGGDRQLPYPWGATDPGKMNQYAIYDCNYPEGAQECTGVADIAPVGTATAGAARWGQLDLAGNQSQWLLDWYAPYVSPCDDCANASKGGSRVLRGGGYLNAASNLRPTYRDANNPTLRNDFIGIRCARSP